MKMGVKEFRERFSEIAEGGEPVIVTKNGRVIGKYDPLRSTSETRIDWDAIEAKLERIREDWKARTPDWRQRLADFGLDENGEPIDQ